MHGDASCLLILSTKLIVFLRTLYRFGYQD